MFHTAVSAGGKNGATAVEIAFLRVDHEAEADLVGQAQAVGADGMFGGDEIGVGDDQPGLDAGTVERAIADGADAVQASGLEQAVPQRERQPDRNK